MPVVVEFIDMSDLREKYLDDILASWIRAMYVDKYVHEEEKEID